MKSVSYGLLRGIRWVSKKATMDALSLKFFFQVRICFKRGSNKTFLVTRLRSLPRSICDGPTALILSNRIVSWLVWTSLEDGHRACTLANRKGSVHYDQLCFTGLNSTESMGGSGIPHLSRGSARNSDSLLARTMDMSIRHARCYWK